MVPYLARVVSIRRIVTVSKELLPYVPQDAELVTGVPLSLRPMRAWTAVGVLAVAVFAVTATEMLPAGLLPEIARDLSVSAGAAGLCVTAFGVVAGLSAPAVTSWTRMLDRRVLLLIVIGVFVAGNLATAIAPSYPLLLAVRAAIGLVHGVLWSVVASIAVRLVPTASSTTAIAVVFSGISLALVIGVPAGAAIGAWWGWRAAFAALAVLTALTWMGVAALMPTLPAQPRSGAETSWRRLASRRALAMVLVVTAMVVVGNYAAYTYISPLLTGGARLPPAHVGVYLLVYGVAGVIGNLVVGLCIGRVRSLRLVLFVLLLIMTVCLLVLSVVPSTAAVLIAVWGMSYSAVPIVLQRIIFIVAADGREAATALYVMVFNAAIAVGALSGALGLNAFGVCAPALIGAFVCAAAAVAVRGLPVGPHGEAPGL